MKKIIRLLLAYVSILLLVAGCSNDAVENDVEDNTGVPSEESMDDNSTSEVPSSGDLLSIGEAGVLKTAIGDFKVTPTAFRFEEEIDEGEAVEKPYNGTFIIVDMSIENIDDESITSEDLIYSVALENEEGGGGGPITEFTSINNFKGEIAPGEVMTGELIFDDRREERYEFSFGAAYSDSLSNEVRWGFDAEEAE